VYREYGLRCRRGDGLLEHLRSVDARVERMYATERAKHMQATQSNRGIFYAFEVSC
jgi:hypothetical protein